jgi:hypothetical protein
VNAIAAPFAAAKHGDRNLFCSCVPVSAWTEKRARRADFLRR